MPGPLPKPPSQRRRRNVSVASVTLPTSRQPKPPSLPIKGVSAATRSWWKTIWASPMAHAWLEADVPGIARLAGLVEQMNQGDAPLTVLTEIRALEDRYGLSPLARRRLQWEIDHGGEAAQSAPVAAQEERWVRAVSD